MKKTILYIILFCLVGELMIRFDKSYTFMEESRVVKISTDIELTPEFELLQNNSFPENQKDFRIMVLGDSYIHGGGIEFKDNFSQNLKAMINASKGNFDHSWVLDISRPDANNLDNKRSYFQFVNRFNPNVVIIGYNINDIDGNLVEKESNTELPDNGKGVKTSGSETVSLIGKIYKLVYASEFIHFVLRKSHDQLKSFGYTIPGSKFDLTIKSYSQNKENWKQSKKLLKDIILHAEQNDIQLIVYNFPETNHLEHQELFSGANTAIKAFFNEFPSVYYLDGSILFNGEKSKDFRLSKYDGHPNEKAHKRMAKDVFDVIQESNKVYQ